MPSLKVLSIIIKVLCTWLNFVQVNGSSFNNFILVCINNSAIVWLSISYAYKGLLQILAMIMAFHTRKVKNQSSQWFKGNCYHYLYQQHHSEHTDIRWICFKWLSWSLCCSVWPITVGGSYTLPHTALCSKGLYF